MRVLPASKQERFSLLLIPFKVYVIIVPVWFIFVTTDADNPRFGLAEPAGYLLLAYVICIPFFILAALIQFVARWRRAALTSIAFALAAVMFFAILLPVVTRNFWVK